MQIVLEGRSAEILSFPKLRSAANRFTIQDRMDAMAWDTAQAGPAGASLTIHDRQPADAPEVGDYLGIYRANDRWAVWGVAREGAVIKIWHGPSGADLGSFANMRHALAAIGLASIQPRLNRSL